MHSFSVLMSVYKSETKNNLEECFKSLEKQTLKADEVVLVEDGPLPDSLYDIIKTYRNTLNIKSVKIEKNVGLGLALAEGLNHCSNNLVARMDTDDIAYPDRFEVQLKYFKNLDGIDVLGGWITEFDNKPSDIYNKKKLPLTHKEIKEYAKTRCPLNHVTVLFKKDKVLEAGSYQDLKLVEDYYLWIRMLKKGSKFENIPRYLVNVRSGRRMTKRRRNIKRIRNELYLQSYMYSNEFLSFRKFCFNILGRLIFRILPGWMILYAQKKILNN